MWPAGCWRARQATTGPAICGQGCFVVDALANPGGTQTLEVSQGQQFGMVFKGRHRLPPAGPLRPDHPQCLSELLRPAGGATGVYTARTAGAVDMAVTAGGASATVHVVVQ